MKRSECHERFQRSPQGDKPAAYRCTARCLPSLVAALLVAGAEAQAADASPGLEAVETPVVADGEPRPVGWLSDPASSPRDAFEALVSGKVHLNNRTRFEFADTTGRNSSSAFTNRLRLGYESKPFFGLSGFVEMENVATPAPDNFFVPATGDGTPDRTVVADPPGTEINRAYARWSPATNGDLRPFVDIRAGRQRIKLDDDRFIGNIGWRQFEQTFDAASINTDLGVEDLEIFYAYVWRVQRIFGPDGTNPDSQSHLINARYKVSPELTATAFAYLLDFRGDEPLNSSNSFGVRLTGTLASGSDTSADYEVTYAHQTDAGSNPVDYNADFVAAQVKLNQAGLGFVLAGYQFLGSDDGVFAFRFPLGTNHKFQGFADNFLVTPAGGLQDAFVGVGGELPFGVKASVTYHEYWSDIGGDDQGEELNAVARKQLRPNWTALVKAAYFDGDSGQPDTTRLWAQTTFSF
ncbi:MAG: alginate export family protein [Planctomycetota bacterium]